MIEFAENAPRWRQIADVLRARIEDGTYAPDTRVPSLVQITAEFGVASATAQKALRALREQGWTYTEQGLGSFVARRGADDETPPPGPGGAERGREGSSSGELVEGQGEAAEADGGGH
ncbi:GntR family transcriptional regulator [Streptomyces pseudogriseolus]|uniref:GntR family transcriptional regulator n=1 Tax=Streptomyces pseudogriseolus TaxID=36817 RepID=UPI003FA2AF25